MDETSVATLDAMSSGQTVLEPMLEEGFSDLIAQPITAPKHILASPLLIRLLGRLQSKQGWKQKQSVRNIRIKKIEHSDKKNIFYHINFIF
jgi:hypothetical protein